MNKNRHINNNSALIQNMQERFLGAYFNNDNSCNIKIFTFPDLDKLELELKRKNLPIKRYNMNNKGKGIFELRLGGNEVNSGDRYRFIINSNNEEYSIKDPCSMWQDSYFKWSKLYNHNLYKWTDEDWINGFNENRISRLANETNGFGSVNDLRIYELHIGTLTEEGTFLSAKEKIKEIAEKYRFNAIEIMPVENTYSFNWGYDGVDKYSPNHTYGTPDDLKELINYAHEIGINVIMDIVPNHLGPDIAELQKSGPYIECTNCFGYKFNFEQDTNSRYVRDYIIGAALNWVLNYHCDGLRVDMTKFMCSDYTMKQMAAELNYYAPNAFLIAEDGRENDSRVTKAFSRTDTEENILHHENFINKIRDNSVSLNALGFDSEWDFPFHKQIASSILGCWECYTKNIFNFDNALKDAQSRVKYPMSHDEIGNIDGTRLITKVLERELKLYYSICDCSQDEKCKKSAHCAQAIIESLVSGELESMNNEQRINFYKEHSIEKEYTVDTIKQAYKKAIEMHKLAIGKTFSIPGPKMIFQGDESANISYFKFFRKFSAGIETCLLDKGYKPGLCAFKDSKLCANKYCEEYRNIHKGIELYTSDLNKLCENNISLGDGTIEKTYVNAMSEIHAIHCKKIYNEIFSISNFSDTTFKGDYGILFPKGQWKEVLNSNDKKYSGSGEYLNEGIVAEQFTYISIPPYGITFFEKI